MVIGAIASFHIANSEEMAIVLTTTADRCFLLMQHNCVATHLVLVLTYLCLSPTLLEHCDMFSTTTVPC